MGNVTKSAALKALLTWVDRGVLKEASDNTFVLLEVAEAVTTQRDRRVAEEEPADDPAQQQQSQQMVVYWKVRSPSLSCELPFF